MDDAKGRGETPIDAETPSAAETPTDAETPSAAQTPTDAEPSIDRSGWREFATDTAGELRRQLAGAPGEVSEADADKVARRLADAIDDALEVPEDLPLRIAGNVARLRAEADPDEDAVALAWVRTRERARRTAAIGAVTTIPSMIPVLGTAIAALGVVADWRYVAAQQRDLVLEIAALFDVRLDDPTGSVRALFLTSTGAALAGSAVGEAVGRAAGRTAARAAARQAARRGLARLAPGVGAVVAGALNYTSTVAIGRAAIGRFARQAGVEVRGVIPGVAHPAMDALRGWITDPAAGEDAPPQAAALPELSASERDELIDLAVVATAGEEGGDARLARIVETLGFDPDEVAEAQTSFASKVRGFAKRFREQVARAGAGGRRAAWRVWRDARTLARRARGWRRRRKDLPPTESSPEA